MTFSKIAVVLYLLLKLVFNRDYEWQEWLNTLYYVVEPLCFTLILIDMYKLHFFFEVVFWVAFSFFVRQVLIYAGYWQYDWIGRKYLVEYAFLFGIVLVLLRHGNSYFGKNINLRKLYFDCLLWVRTRWRDGRGNSPD